MSTGLFCYPLQVEYKSVHFSHLAGNRAKACFEGFTLMELLIVVAIISTLAAIAVPNFINYRHKAKIALAIAEICLLEKDIANYVVENDQYPDRLNDIGKGNLEDPWGNPYRYLRIAGADPKAGTKGKQRKDHSMVPVNSDYDLYSMGRDGDSKPPFTAKASRDDIVRANDGKFIGLASDY